MMMMPVAGDREVPCNGRDTRSRVRRARSKRTREQSPTLPQAASAGGPPHHHLIESGEEGALRARLSAALRALHHSATQAPPVRPALPFAAGAPPSRNSVGDTSRGDVAARITTALRAAPGELPQLKDFDVPSFQPYREALSNHFLRQAYHQWQVQEDDDILRVFVGARRFKGFMEWYCDRDREGGSRQELRTRANRWLREAIRAKMRQSLARSAATSTSAPVVAHPQRITPVEYMGVVAAETHDNGGHRIVCLICSDKKMKAARNILGCDNNHVVCDDCIEDFKTKTTRPADLPPNCVPCPYCRRPIRFPY